jgi:hypothetical protein
MGEKLKVFIQGRFFMPGCCGVTMLRATDGEELFSNPEEFRAPVGELIDAVKERYGDALEVSLVNSWGFLSLWDVVRLGIKPSVPTWVMRSKKIHEGVPSLDVLFETIDGELGRPACLSGT